MSFLRKLRSFEFEMPVSGKFSSNQLVLFTTHKIFIGLARIIDILEHVLVFTAVSDVFITKEPSTCCSPLFIRGETPQGFATPKFFFFTISSINFQLLSQNSTSLVFEAAKKLYKTCE